MDMGKLRQTKKVEQGPPVSRLGPLLLLPFDLDDQGQYVAVVEEEYKHSPINAPRSGHCSSRSKFRVLLQLLMPSVVSTCNKGCSPGRALQQDSV